MKRLSPTRFAHLLYAGAVVLLLSVPMLTHHWRSDPGVRASENREAAPPPGLPRNWPEALAWTTEVDAYVADHFGRRTAMVRAFNRARFQLFGETPSPQTVPGRHGRIFFSSHSAATPYSLIRFICGAGVTDADLDRATADLGNFLDIARQATATADVRLLVVPTAPTLYFDDLPSWLRDQCPPVNTMDRLLPRLPDGELRRRLFYPLPAMLAARARGEVIPLTNFHWEGLGAQTAAAAFAEEALGLPRRFTPPLRDVREPSDMAHMMPGIPTGNLVRLTDFAAAGIDYCQGAACFPELGSMAAVVYDLSRLRSPRGGDKKLLILSDSFGIGVAGWFAPYFGQVWHLSVSNLGRLSDEERRTLRQRIFDDYHPDEVLYLFHDGSVHYWPRMAAMGLWGAFSPPSE